MTTPAIAVFGEALVDVMRTPTTTTIRPGGSPMNVAVGLARLGAEVELATSIGDDAEGRVIRQHLSASGVRVADGSVLGGATSRAEATIDAEGTAQYRFELEWDPRSQPSRVAQAGHFGSIAAVLQPGARRVREWAGALPESSAVSFDPNIRPTITRFDETVGAVTAGAHIADLIKLSSEDLAYLRDPDLTRRWTDAGKIVITTDGPRGARIETANGRLTVPAPVVRVVDTVGAGDSFMSGLLWSLSVHGLLHRQALRAATLDALIPHVRFAAACAAITVGRQGADPPRLDEVSAVAGDD